MAIIVRPLAGAGIEINGVPPCSAHPTFAPSRGRELKFRPVDPQHVPVFVRPLAGAGIEIFLSKEMV